MNYDFSLNKEQIALFEKWSKSLPAQKIQIMEGARFIFEFVPTSIGIFVSVKDMETNEKLDLTGEL